MAQSIKVLVDGGKASAGPPLGPALGPTGINVGQVVAQINEKTKSFVGMKVPVEVTINPKTKEFDIKTGSPPTSQLIMKEIGVDKLSSNPKFQKVGNIAIEQAIKIADGKIDSMNCLELKSAVKTVCGSCVSLGVLVEGKEPNDAIDDINAGKYDNEISNKTTEVSAEKKARLKEQLSATSAELEKELSELKKEEEAEKPAEEEAAEGEVKEAPEGEEGAAPAEGGAKEGSKEEKKEG